MIFYNTNQEEGETLEKSKVQTITQEDKVLAYFKRRRGAYTPSYIWASLFGQSIPITSVRRSLTNLTIAGHLEKLDNLTTEGIYGKQEHYWQLAEPKPAPKLF